MTVRARHVVCLTGSWSGFDGVRARAGVHFGVSFMMAVDENQ